MGKSDSKYKRHITITQHSIEALIKRRGTLLNYRGKVDLGNQLDAAVHAAFDQAEVWYERVDDERVDDRILLTHAVHLRDPLDGLVAVVRDDLRRPGIMACITVLTRHMAAQNETNGQWARTPERLGKEGLTSSPFADIAVPDEAPPDEAEVLLTWKVSGTLKLEHLFIYPRQVKAQLDRLNALAGVVDLTLWKSVPFKIETKTTVEFEL